MPARPDDRRIDDLLIRWYDLRESGFGAGPPGLTDDPELLPALVRAIAEIEAAEEGLGLGPPGVLPEPTGLLGRYEVFGPPLKGGMGEVYRARDLEVEGREVAYKVMRWDGEPTPAQVQQFYREARITDQVRQPGVVPIYAQFRDGSGRPAYAMEYVEGETLGAARAGFEAGCADARRCVEVLRRFLDACRIVGVAHAKGVVHGDLNSRNILLIEDRQATRVVDWGSAVEVGTEDESRPPHSVAPDYRDPALGPDDPPTSGSDVYALGVGLGKLARSFEVGRIGGIGGRKGVSVLRALRAIAGRAAASRPGDRYPDAPSLAADLERLLSGQRVHADRDEPLSERAWRWASRHRAAVTSAAIALALGGVLIAVLIYASQVTRRSRQVDLSSRYGEIVAACNMLEQEGDPVVWDRSEGIPVLRTLIERRDEASSDLARSLEALEKDLARRDGLVAQETRARRARLEGQINAGSRILESLIEEFPEIEGHCRQILAHGYINLARLKFNGVLDGQELAAIVGEYLAGKPRSRAARADFESALVLADRALSILPPPRRDAPATDHARHAYQDAYLVKMVAQLGLGRHTEALQNLNAHLDSYDGTASPAANLRPGLIKVAESEQQRLPWSRPPAVDHARAVAMAEYLAAQGGVSDAAVYNAACAHSLAAADALAGAVERERRAARAVELLRRIAARGYFHGFRLYPPPMTDTLKELATDHDLDPLRGRPDFRALVAGLSSARR